MINFDTVLSWMDYIRNDPDGAYRFAECFWPSQIKSKERLLERLPKSANYAVFGGWYGILAQMIEFKYPFAKVINIDIDPKCKEVFDYINHSPNITHITSCMSGIDIASLPRDTVLINTSSEHVEQHVYDAWWNSIPEGMLYIVQGNNLKIDEHIRITETVEEFLEINHLHASFFVDEIDCDTFTRFMAIGIK